MIPQTGAEFIAPAAQCPPAQTSLNGVDYRPAGCAPAPTGVPSP